MVNRRTRIAMVMVVMAIPRVIRPVIIPRIVIGVMVVPRVIIAVPVPRVIIPVPRVVIAVIPGIIRPVPRAVETPVVIAPAAVSRQPVVGNYDSVPVRVHGNVHLGRIIGHNGVASGNVEFLRQIDILRGSCRHLGLSLSRVDNLPQCHFCEGIRIFLGLGNVHDSGCPGWSCIIDAVRISSGLCRSSTGGNRPEANCPSDDSGHS